MPKLIKSFGPYGIYLVEGTETDCIDAIQRAKYQMYTGELGERERNIADTGIMLNAAEKKEDCIFDKSPRTVYIVAARKNGSGARIVSAMRIVPWTKERHLPMENVKELGNGYPEGVDLGPYMDMHGITPENTYEFGRYFKLPPEESNGKNRNGDAYKFVGFIVMRSAHDFVCEKGSHDVFACAKPPYAKGRYMPIGMKPIVVKGQQEEKLYPDLEMIDIVQLPVRKKTTGRKMTIGKYEYPMPSTAAESYVSDMNKFTFIPLHLDSKKAIERASKGEFCGQNGETDLNEDFMLVLTPESFPIYKNLLSRTKMEYAHLKERARELYKDAVYGAVPSKDDIKIPVPKISYWQA